MESSYNLLLSGDSRTDDIPIQETTTFSYTNHQLITHDVYPKGMVTWMKNRKVDGKVVPVTEKEVKFFKLQSTNKTSAKQIFTNMQTWFVEHVMDKLYKHKPGVRKHLKKLLMEDPVGITEPDKDDAH